MDTVELSPAVAQARSPPRAAPHLAARSRCTAFPGLPPPSQVAAEWFGLVADARRVLHVEDAGAFLARQPAAAFDVVVIDISASGDEGGSPAEEGGDGDWLLELPPPAFLEEARRRQRDRPAALRATRRQRPRAWQAFISGQLARVLRDGGVAVVNVMAGRQRLLQVEARLRSCFEQGGGALRVLATDPNYLFYASKGQALPRDAAAVLAALDAAPPAVAAMLLDARGIVERTSGHVRRRSLMGWLAPEQFVNLVRDARVRV